MKAYIKPSAKVIKFDFEQTFIATSLNDGNSGVIDNNNPLQPGYGGQ